MSNDVETASIEMLERELTPLPEADSYCDTIPPADGDQPHDGESTRVAVAREPVRLRPDRVRAMPSPRRAPVRCTKTQVNFWLDAGLLVTYVLLAWVTAVLNFVFPATADATGWLLWGGDVVFWRNVQFGILSAFTIALGVHLMLHWSWICGVINKQIFRRTVIQSNGSDTLVGVGLIAVVLHVLAIGLVVAWWCVERP